MHAGLYRAVRNFFIQLQNLPRQVVVSTLPNTGMTVPLLMTFACIGASYIATVKMWWM